MNNKHHPGTTTSRTAPKTLSHLCKQARLSDTTNPPQNLDPINYILRHTTSAKQIQDDSTMRLLISPLLALALTFGATMALPGPIMEAENTDSHLDFHQVSDTVAMWIERPR